MCPIFPARSQAGLAMPYPGSNDNRPDNRKLNARSLNPMVLLDNVVIQLGTVLRLIFNTDETTEIILVSIDRALDCDWWVPKSPDLPAN